LVKEEKVRVAGTLTVATEALATEDFVVRSPKMLSLYEVVEKVARRNLPVLITGETGVGKEHVARSIHDRSERRGRFVAVNCGAVPPLLTESILFGHEKGAFTGAERQANGVFEQAAGGTLFLDEIGELNHRGQVALLRVLQEKRLSRVGSNREVVVDVRVVAATHVDLAAMVTAKTFRDDLFYRLSGAELFVPALRERTEEIPLLASAFLRRATAASGDERCFFGSEAMATLLQYSWPGNVRQLWNVVQFAAVVHKGMQIRPEDFPPEIRVEMAACIPIGSVEGSAETKSRNAPRPMSLRQRVKEYEATLIRECLAQTGGRVADTARLLSIPVRTLNNKLSAYGIRPSTWVSRDAGTTPLRPVREAADGGTPKLAVRAS
jgi:DNA-binding NtrC family response regulator